MTLFHAGDLGRPANHVKGLVIGQDMTRELLVALRNRLFASFCIFYGSMYKLNRFYLTLKDLSK
jgi:hypothetical protein